MSSNRVLFLPTRITGDLTTTDFSAEGPPLEKNVHIIIVGIEAVSAVIISFDGINDHIYAVRRTTTTINLSTTRILGNRLYLPKGTQLYAKAAVNAVAAKLVGISLVSFE